MNAAAETEQCEIIVIGGGLAGLCAAAAARKAGREVVVASRGRAGAGGCSVLASGGFAVAGHPGDHPDDHYRDTFQGGYRIGQPDLIRNLVDESSELLLELSGTVAGFAMCDGRLQGKPVPAHGFPRSVQYLRGMPDLLASMRAELERSGVRIKDGHRCVRLDRLSGGRVRGLWLYDESVSSLRYLAAGSVVLAGGGAGQLYPVTSNGPDATGDSYALAMEAGCTLRDMEFVQFTPTAFAAPESVRGRTIVGTLLTLPGVVLTNSRGERFMERYDPVRMELADRAALARAITMEILAGRGTLNGGAYLDIRSVAASELDRHRPGFHRVCHEAGVNPEKQLLETAPSAHTFLGGIMTDGNMQVCEGLHAAGEAVGGVHGANRLSSNSLTDSLVSGWRAGTSAADDCDVTSPKPRSAPPEIPDLGPVKPEAFLARVRREMGRSAGVVRNGTELTSGLDEIRKIREEARSCLGRGVTDPGKWFDLQCLLSTAEAVLTASVFRQESRGAHYRQDFPEQNDEDWLGSVLLQQMQGDLHARFHSDARIPQTH